MSNLVQDDFNYLAIHQISDHNKIIEHQIGSYNEFIRSLPSTIKHMFTQNKSVEYNEPFGDERIVKVKYGLRFDNIKIVKPQIVKQANSRPLYPNEAKNTNKTYKCRLNADICLYKQKFSKKDKKIVADEKRDTVIKDAYIGSIPIMVKSEMCNLFGLPEETLIEINEDPADLGGYFILHGSSKILYSRKNNIKNIPLYIRDSATESILCKLTSQLGDAHDQSKYMVLELYKNNLITVKFTLGKDLEFIAPFYILFHLFGITNDKQIFNTILPGYDSSQIKHITMLTMFREAMKGDYNKIKVSISNIHNFKVYEEFDTRDNRELCLTIARIINKNNKATYAKRYKFANINEEQETCQQINSQFDELVCPHIGKSYDHRIKKLKYIGLLIKKLFNIYLGDDLTDRNSLENTPVYNPNPGLTQTFVTVFNITIATRIMSNITTELLKNPDASLEKTATQNLDPAYLGNILSKALKAGNNPEIKVKNENVITNRINTVQKDYTNHGAEVSILRSITNNPNAMGGKHNEPLLRSRGVHATHSGGLCLLQSIEGEDTGKVTQMAITAEITGVISSSVLTELVEKDLEPISRMNEKDGNFYSQVFVNGKPLGSHHDTRILAQKYRLMRRQGLIDYKVSIEYKSLENGDLYLYTHVGRIISPKIIVYTKRTEKDAKYSSFPSYPHNYDSKKAPSDRSWILFTKEHAMGLRNKTITVYDLVREGVVEYISASEMKNIIVAENYDVFMKNRNNPIREYTHLDIPISNMSISMLCCTFGNHCQPVRAVYQTKFIKQSMAFATINYSKDFFSKVPLRYNVYKTLVQTIGHKVLKNYGVTSVRVLIMSANYNQEDSIIISQSFAEKEKFSSDYLNSVSVEIDKNQVFETPVPDKVQGIRSIDYSHLINGAPIPGTVIKPGMPLIGIVETVDGVKKDRSKYHTKTYEVIVTNVIQTYNEHSSRICRVGYKTIRPVEPGDKFAAQSGCKGVVSIIKPTEELPISKDGIIPDIIINPCSFPSRMVVNQLMEGQLGNICAASGTYADATMFKEYDEEKMDALSEKYGIDKNGLYEFYDGITGKKIRSKLCMIFNNYHRLNKMAEDNSAAVDKTTKDSRTQQPKKSVNKGGGTRYGYMEIDTLAAHGGGLVMQDALCRDSDGKTMYVCDTCHRVVPGNPKQSVFYCNSCKHTTFSKYMTTHNSQCMVNYSRSLGLDMAVVFDPPSFPIKK